MKFKIIIVSVAVLVVILVSMSYLIAFDVSHNFSGTVVSEVSDNTYESIIAVDDEFLNQHEYLAWLFANDYDLTLGEIVQLTNYDTRKLISDLDDDIDFDSSNPVQWMHKEEYYVEYNDTLHWIRPGFCENTYPPFELPRCIEGLD